jgi:hypothetical protein
MTISEAKVDADNDFVPDLIDSAATLTGIASSFNFSTSRTDFFMQDGQAGISVLMFGTMANISIGDSVSASGIISQYYGKTQLQVYDIDRIQNHGGGHHLDTLDLTCAQMADGEVYEGRLVRVIGADITADPDPWPTLGSPATMNINDGTSDLMLRIDASTNIPGQNQPEGAQNIVGCLGQYTYVTPANGGYQLMPRRFADFEDYVSVDEVQNLPMVTSLGQNYPNPFNPSTSVMFSLAQAGDVEFTIYDILGQRVYEVKQQDVTAGTHSIIWNGTDMAGAPVASGAYFYRLKAGDFVDTKQMTLIK